jgi:hypothetical protein
MEWGWGRVTDKFLMKFLKGRRWCLVTTLSRTSYRPKSVALNDASCPTPPQRYFYTWNTNRHRFLITFLHVLMSIRMWKCNIQCRAHFVSIHGRIIQRLRSAYSSVSDILNRNNIYILQTWLIVIMFIANFSNMAKRTNVWARIFYSYCYVCSVLCILSHCVVLCTVCV